MNETKLEPCSISECFFNHEDSCFRYYAFKGDEEVGCDVEDEEDLVEVPELAGVRLEKVLKE